jgi:hypothetical protein
MSWPHRECGGLRACVYRTAETIYGHDLEPSTTCLELLTSQVVRTHDSTYDSERDRRIAGDLTSGAGRRGLATNVRDLSAVGQADHRRAAEVAPALLEQRRVSRVLEMGEERLARHQPHAA